MQEQTVQREKVHRFRCPGCGADLQFAPEGGNLTCPYCGRQEQIAPPPGAVEERSYDSTCNCTQTAWARSRRARSKSPARPAARPSRSRRRWSRASATSAAARSSRSRASADPDGRARGRAAFPRHAAAGDRLFKQWLSLALVRAERPEEAGHARRLRRRLHPLLDLRRVHVEPLRGAARRALLRDRDLHGDGRAGQQRDAGRGRSGTRAGTLPPARSRAGSTTSSSPRRSLCRPRASRA